MVQHQHAVICHPPEFEHGVNLYRFCIESRGLALYPMSLLGYFGSVTVSESVQDLDALVNRRYEAGFVTDIESETLAPGLSEETVRFISAKKGEPEWMLQWRLEAFRQWQTLTPPDWAHLNVPPIDYQSISYFSAPKSKDDAPKSLDEVDPELLRTYEKLGFPGIGRPRNARLVRIYCGA